MLEILAHDGPGRLGKFHVDDKLVMTPEFFSLSPDAGHILHLGRGGDGPNGACVMDMGSLFSPGDALIGSLTLPPDFPVGLDVPRSLAEFSVEATLDAATEEPGVGGVICGSKYLDLRERCATKLQDRPLLVLADGFKLIRRPRLLVDIVSLVRSTISPNCALYFPFAPPHAFPLLAYMGVDLFDSGYGDIEATRRRMVTTRGGVDADSLKELSCTCPACSGKTPLEMGIGDIKSHNFNITAQACSEVRESMRQAEIRNLVEERAATDADLMAALRILDSEKQGFLLEYTSTN